MSNRFVSGFCAGLGIFTAGFVLGIIRTIWLLPRFPEWQAVLVEGPFILALAWLILRFFIRRGAIGAAIRTRLTFGTTALLTLWLCEWIMTMTMMNESPAFFFQSFGTVPGAIGLAGQLLIIIMPLWVKLPQDEESARS